MYIERGRERECKKTREKEERKKRERKMKILIQMEIFLEKRKEHVIPKKNLLVGLVLPLGAEGDMLQF